MTESIPQTDRSMFQQNGFFRSYSQILPKFSEVFRPPEGARCLPDGERTFAWFGQNRRLSKDYERCCATSEAMIYATMSRLMVRHLAAL